MKKILNNHFFPIRRDVDKALREVYHDNGLHYEYIKEVTDDSLESFGIDRRNLIYLEGQSIGYVTIIKDEFRNELIINLKLNNDEDKIK